MKPNTRKNASRKRSKKTRTSNAPSPLTQQTILPPSLSSINLAKILSGFMTFRSTVKDLSHTIKHVETFMDTAYQMFEIASRMLIQSKRKERSNPFSFLQGQEPQHHHFDDEEIPVIHLPAETKKGPGDFGNPLIPLLQNIDLNQLMAVIQSPLFQKLVSHLFQTSKPTTSSFSKRKQG